MTPLRRSFATRVSRVVYLEEGPHGRWALDAKPELRKQFLDQWIYEAGIRTDMYHDIITDYIESNYPATKEMVMKTMAGTCRSCPRRTHLLGAFAARCAPMPNDRDPFAMTTACPSTACTATPVTRPSTGTTS